MTMHVPSECRRRVDLREQYSRAALVSGLETSKIGGTRQCQHDILLVTVYYLVCDCTEIIHK